MSDKLTRREDAGPTLAAPRADGAARGLTGRAVLLGLFLVVLLAVATVYSDNIAHNSYLIDNHLPFTVVFVIMLFGVVINPLLGARRFHATELIVAIAMMLVGAAVPSSGFYRLFQPLLADTVYLSSTILWYTRYLNALPDWLLPSKSPTAPIITNFYLGMDARNARGLGWTVGPWLVPYASWALFYVPTMVLAMLFCALMRKQWVVHERLGFPLATLPMEMMADPAPGRRVNALWRSPLLWIAVLIPVVAHLSNGLALFYTSTPVIPLHYNISTALSEFPWNALHYRIKENWVYFSMVGVAFFVPLEVTFSLWSFFLGYQALLVFVQAQGTTISAGEQTAESLGVVIAYGLLLLWIARHHLWYVLRHLNRPREPEEFLSYRTTVAGMLLCTLVSGGFLTAAFGSMARPGNWALALLIITSIVFFAMVLTRLVMEAGVLLIQLPGEVYPLRLVALLFESNPAVLTVRQWMMTALVSYGTFTDQRELLMPFAANAARMGSAVPPRQRRKYFFLLIAALLLSLVVAGTLHHVLSYEYGRQTFDDGFGPTGHPMRMMDAAHDAAEPRPSTANAPLHFIYGAAAVVFVGVLRLMWVNCPVHPIGLLMFNNWAIGEIWFSVFIAWALKFVVMRWGGVRVYQRVRPFFIGLIVGDAIAGMIWVIVGLLVAWPNGVPYRILPH